MKKKSRKLPVPLYVPLLVGVAVAGGLLGVTHDLVTAAWTLFQARLYAGLRPPSSESVSRETTSTTPSRPALEIVKPPSYTRRSGY
jgi:hypothetical protein